MTDVYYGGTENDYEGISIGSNNNKLTGAAWHYNILAAGICGNNLSWGLDNDGVLTISGTGAMTDYPGGGVAPWYAYAGSIQSVVIGNDVTSIGSFAFWRCRQLMSITLSESLLSIGDSAFSQCSGLTGVVTIPDSVTSIGKSAFVSCNKLASITIGKSVTSIGNWAFENCTSLESITIPDSVTSIGA